MDLMRLFLSIKMFEFEFSPLYIVAGLYLYDANVKLYV